MPLIYTAFQSTNRSYTMKPRFFTLLVPVLLIMACEERTVGVRTDYRDLPASRAEDLKQILKTPTLDVLPARSLNVLLQYARSKLLRLSAPGQRISGNYFRCIYNALPDFVNVRERHRGYYRDGSQLPGRDKLIAYAIYRLDRSPANLKRVYAYVKPLLRKAVPPAVFRKRRLRRKIDHYLRVYRHLDQTSGAWQTLDTFYAKTYTPRGEIRPDQPHVKKYYHDGAYGFSAYRLGEMLSREVGLSRHSPLYGSAALSFWMRRRHEGNAAAVVEILRSLLDLYTDPPSHDSD